MATRREILERLMALQAETKMNLIRETEIERIRELWVEDVVASTHRNAEAQRAASAGGA